MNNNELQEQVIQWASDKYLLSKDNVLKQFAKFISEAGELGDAIIKNEREETIDAIGDVQVTLIILCEQLDLDYDKCLETAYNVIKNRRGKTIGGTFIKSTPAVYCIEVTRDSEDPFVFHSTFNEEPTRRDILNEIEDQGINYDDNYGKINYYKVS